MDRGTLWGKKPKIDKIIKELLYTHTDVFSKEEVMDKKEKDEIIRDAVALAQADACRKGFTVDQEIAHPSDEYIYYFLRTEVQNGIDVAVVHIPASLSETGEEIEKCFPIRECFNPHDAVMYSTGMVWERFNPHN